LLFTLFAEVQFIVNSRPLTPVLIDPQQDEPLTPNHFLMMRGSYDHSHGVFQSSDQFLSKKMAPGSIPSRAVLATVALEVPLNAPATSQMASGRTEPCH